MKRSIFLFATGSLMMLGGQIGLSMSTHPDHAVTLRFFLQSGLGLMLGSAIAVSGMLGLAEGYERAAGQLSELLESRRTDGDTELPVKDRRALHARNRSFWRAYLRSGLSVGLFLSGLLAVAVLAARASFLFYLFFLGAGAAFLGTLALLLAIQALRAIRRTHREVEDSARALALQPEVPSGSPQAEGSEVRWVVQRKSPVSYSRHLDTRGRSQSSVKR